MDPLREGPERPPGTPITIAPARVDEIHDLQQLIYLWPPAFWMRRIPDLALRRFLAHAVRSPRAVALLARPTGESTPAGYVLAIRDARRFWRESLAREPRIAFSIARHRLQRLIGQRVDSG